MSADTSNYNNPLNDIIKLLDDRFKEDELNFICLELSIDFQDYKGNMRTRCQSLVTDLYNSNRLDELLNVIEKENLSLQSELERIRSRLNEATISSAPSPPQSQIPSSTPQVNQTHIIIAAIVVFGLLGIVFLFLRNNSQSQAEALSPSPPTDVDTSSVAVIIEPTIEEDRPEPKPTDTVEPTDAIVETAVPDPTQTTEPEPIAIIEPTDIPTSVPTETPIPTDTPVPTETPAPLIEIELLSTLTRDQDNQLMFYVPAGSFQMGASPSDTSAEGDEYPRHDVTLDAFWIDQSEVTNQQYQICVEEGACEPVPSAGQLASADNYPRVNVTWNDALAYCEWAGATLPTEAQWEYAARGTDGRIYPWGNDAPTCQKVNYGGCLNYPQPVASYPSGSSWSGALDMSGNVYEWVSDWYNYNYYQNSPANQPLNAITANAKARRGGSYFHSSNQVRATNRDSLSPTNSSSNTGFRCVVNITD